MSQHETPSTDVQIEIVDDLYYLILADGERIGPLKHWEVESMLDEKERLDRQTSKS